MDAELEKLRNQLKEAKRREQEAQRLREEEQRLRKEQLCKKRTGKSTLPEFLDACHKHLYLGLTIQPDSTQSTQMTLPMQRANHDPSNITMAEFLRATGKCLGCFDGVRFRARTTFHIIAYARGVR